MFSTETRYSPIDIVIVKEHLKMDGKSHTKMSNCFPKSDGFFDDIFHENLDDFSKNQQNMGGLSDWSEYERTGKAWERGYIQQVHASTNTDSLIVKG